MHGRIALHRMSLLVLLPLALVLGACGQPAPSPTAAPAPTKPAAAAPTAAPAAPTTAPAPAKPTAAPAPPKELKKVKLGSLGSTSEAGIFIAIAHGYFAAEGIENELIDFDTAAKMIAPLGTGQLDVGGGAVSAGLFNAVARGVEVKVVADKGSFTPGHGFSVLMVRKDLADSGAIKQLSDLKGKTIAVTATGASPHINVMQALKQGGVDPKDAEIVAMAHPDMVVAFKQKAIDAAVITEPNAVIAEHEGFAVRWMPLDKINPNGQNAVILYSGKWAADNPALAQAWMRAYIRGVRDYNDALDKNRDKPGMIAILQKYTILKDAQVYQDMIWPGLNPNGTVGAAQVQEDLNWYTENGFVKDKVDLAQVVDQSYNQAAVEKLGPYK